MDDFVDTNLEPRYDYLKLLSPEEQQQMIKELEEDIKKINEILNANTEIPGEEINELYSDRASDEYQIRYLKSLLNQKSL